jgi:CelD/BcsL family acetyltransferase involved in cellulose biosynthesis
MKVVEQPVPLPALGTMLPYPQPQPLLGASALDSEAAGRPAPEITVSEVRDRSGFMRLATEWEALTDASKGDPFYRHEFIRIWLDNFAPHTKLRVLLARDGDGSLLAALPLIEERAQMLGMPVRQLVAAANDHSCRFDLIANHIDGEKVGRAFWAHLAADRGWDLLRISDVPEGGNAWHLYNAAMNGGYPVHAQESLNSPYICLPTTSAEMQARLQSKFRANLRRRRRKLEEKGRVTVERITGGIELQGKLEEGYDLERSGWKGQGGTAIAQSTQTWGFYSELARTAAYGGYLSLYFMRLDGEPVAFQYGLTREDHYYLLKPSYSEAHAECSPGQLLMAEVLEDCIARGVKEFDFLGPDMIWKRDWTDQTRKHMYLYVFRDSAYGKTLHRARFDWARLAKELMKGWRKP